MPYNRDSGNDLVYDGNTGEYIPVSASEYILTISPSPIDATVVLTATGFTQVGNSITVDPDTVVSYTVSKTGYITTSGNITVTSDITLPITLGKVITVTILPTPSDATVTLTSTGYTQSGNTIQADTGNTVSYTVSKSNYTTKTGTVLAGNENANVPVAIWPTTDNSLHIKMLHGNNAQNEDYLGVVGELTMDTELNQLRLHDGVTRGGHIIGQDNGDSDHGVSLFDTKWVDHILNDECWLRTETFSWQDGELYTLAYQHLVSDISGIRPTTETIQNIPITYYQATDGHKIILPNQEQYAVAIFEATGVAWYYILDTENTRFKLPRASNPGTAWYLPLNVAVSEYGANQQYLYMYIGNYRTNSLDNNISVIDGINQRLSGIHNAGTITINQGGTQKAQFSLNQDTDVTVNLQDLPGLPSTTEDDYTRVVRVGKNGVYELGSEQYTPNLFDYKRSDHKLNDASWLNADTFSWQYGSMYEAAYDHLIEDLQPITVSQFTGTLSTVNLSGPWYRREYRDVGEFYLWENSNGDLVCTNSAAPVADDVFIPGSYASSTNTWNDALSAATTADIRGTVSSPQTAEGATVKQKFLKHNCILTGTASVDENHVLNGFSTTANFGQAYGLHTPTSSFELVVKFKMPSTISNSSIVSTNINYHGLIIRATSATNIKIWMSSNGSSWNVYSSIDHTCDIPVNSIRWFKLVWSGTDYKFYISTDGTTYTQIGSTVTSSLAPYLPEGLLNFGGCAWENYSFGTDGYVYLDDTYVKIDGQTVWKGTTYFNYYEAADGHRIVLSDKEDAIEYLYNNDKDAWYYIIDPKISAINLNVTNFNPLNRDSEKDGTSDKPYPYAWSMWDGLDWWVFYTDSEYPKIGDLVALSPTGAISQNLYIASLVFDTTERGRFKLPRGKNRILIDSYTSTNTWYRLYSDGWVEQGGHTQYQASNYASIKVYFPIPMRDTNYTLNFSMTATGDSTSNVTIRQNTAIGYTTTGFTCYNDNFMGKHWNVSGYSVHASKISAESRLYFFVGNFTKTALENTAGVTAEVLNGKVDVDELQNYLILSEFQAPTAANNYTWYKKYTNGWVEQGGYLANTASGVVVSLPVTMANNYYTVSIQSHYTSYGSATNLGCVDCSTSSFVHYHYGDTNQSWSWTVCGMAAQS